jgi:hypothetical protein
MKFLDLFKRPSGGMVAQRELQDAEREYISHMISSEAHANLSAHYLNEANRMKNQIDWLKECIQKFQQ